MESVPKVERQCSGCKQVKPWTLEYFRPAARRKRDGVYPVSTYCRECVRADSRRYAKSYVRPKKPKVPKPVKLKQCCDCGGEFPRGPENFAIDAHYCRPCGQLRLERAIEQAKARAAALLMHRTCRHCGETKANTAEFFYPDASNTCKTCWKARTKEYIRQNPLVRRAKNQRRRAREKNAPGRHGAADIRRQFAQQQGLCYWCRGKLETSGDNKFHVDHLIALAKGGSNGPENIVCACPGCNGAKSDKMPWEFAGRLL